MESFAVIINNVINYCFKAPRLRCLRGPGYTSTFFMLHFFHVALFSCCTFFMLHFFPVALFSCCTIFLLHFLHAALFPRCTFFTLHYFDAAFFPCCSFPCCTLFMLHSFHVALFMLMLKNIENERDPENTTKAPRTC